MTIPGTRHLGLLLLAVLALVAAACGDPAQVTIVPQESGAESTRSAPADAPVPAATLEPSTESASPAPASPQPLVPAETEPAPVETDAGAPGLDLAFAGLPPLAGGATYEAWLIPTTPAPPISIGQFGISADGSVDTAIGVDLSPGMVDNVGSIVVSIEPADDTDPAPSATRVLAGTIVDGRAELTIDHPAALGTDFSGASGVYILGTPTDGDGNNELSGVWFIDLPLATGLVLPELAEGWHYEGWAIIEGVPVPTGRIDSPDAADDFDGFSGPEGGPNYPGEDFIVNPPEGLSFPTDLTRASVAISVEPDADGDPEPYAITPLFARVPEGIGDHSVQQFDAGPPPPSGTFTLV